MSSVEKADVVRAPAGPIAERAEYEIQTSRLGMWVFISMEILFFSGALLLYTGARYQNPLAFQIGSEHLKLGLASVNTFVLLTSSLTMALSEPLLLNGERKKAVLALFLTAMLGAIFLGLKGYEYVLDAREGLLPGRFFHPSFAAPEGLYLFVSLYMLLTGLHAVHLTIGVVWCLTVAGLVAFRGTGETSVSLSASTWVSRLSVLGLYWHFVDIVWVFLLPLLYLIGSTR